MTSRTLTAILRLFSNTPHDSNDSKETHFVFPVRRFIPILNSSLNFANFHVPFLTRLFLGSGGV